MPPPANPPIGLVLSRTAKAVSRAFDEALAAAGGTLPVWLILLSVKTRSLGTQRELADAIGIRDATLTHHLASLEADGLVTRERDPENRRVQRVALTSSGEEMFVKLAQAAIAFDGRLRAGVSASDVVALRRVLRQLETNVGGDE